MIGTSVLSKWGDLCRPVGCVPGGLLGVDHQQLAVLLGLPGFDRQQLTAFLGVYVPLTGSR
jgi:hypothetical protein